MRIAVARSLLSLLAALKASSSSSSSMALQPPAGGDPHSTSSSLQIPIPPQVGTKLRQNVSWDSRSFLVNGKRLLLTGGEVDYARSTPGMWPTIMKHAKQNGLNCVATYVFWNLHQE